MRTINIHRAIKVPGLLVLLMMVGATLSNSNRLLWSEVAAQQTDFSDEKVVHLLDEPRHRTVHNEGDLYWLDVQVNPGDVSFAHVHDQAILLTTIRTGNGPANGPVRSIPEYATEPLTHKVSNDGPGLLRIIALAIFLLCFSSPNSRKILFNSNSEVLLTISWAVFFCS